MPETLHVTYSKDMLVIHVTLWEIVLWISAEVSKKSQKIMIFADGASYNLKKKTKKNNKLYGPFLWMGFNCLKASATSTRQFTLYH